MKNKIIEQNTIDEVKKPFEMLVIEEEDISEDDYNDYPHYFLKTEREIQEDEFWRVYYPLILNPSEKMGCLDIPGDVITWYRPISCNMKTIPRWTDDGFYMDIKYENRPFRAKSLTWLWQRGKRKIEKQYSLQKILSKRSGHSISCISIKIDNRPIQDFINSTPEEKMNLTRWIGKEERKFFGFIENILDGYMNNHKEE